MLGPYSTIRRCSRPAHALPAPSAHLAGREKRAQLLRRVLRKVAARAPRLGGHHPPPVAASGSVRESSFGATGNIPGNPSSTTAPARRSTARRPGWCQHMQPPLPTPPPPTPTPTTTPRPGMVQPPPPPPARISPQVSIYCCAVLQTDAPLARQARRRYRLVRCRGMGRRRSSVHRPCSHDLSTTRKTPAAPTGGDAGTNVPFRARARQHQRPKTWAFTPTWYSAAACCASSSAPSCPGCRKRIFFRVA